MRLVIRSLVLVTIGWKMLPDYYVYVYDTVRDQNRWVHKKYVEQYPKLYKILTFHGKALYSEIAPQGFLVTT